MPVRYNFSSEEDFLTALRDWFCGQALAGELATFTSQEMIGDAKMEALRQGMHVFQLLGTRCYQIADATIAARKKSSL